MKKKLLATAVAALVAAPMMAQADVKVFGSVQAEVYRAVGNTTVEDGTTGATVSDNDLYVGQMADRGQGQFGVTADEDLGGGMTGYAKINLNTGTNAQPDGDSPYDYTDGTQEGTGPSYRDIYLGLKGGFGDVRMGRMSGIYKSLGGTNWDPFLTTMLEARGQYGMTGGADGHSSYIDRVLYYGSPKLGPVNLHAAYAFDYADTTDNTTTAADDKLGRENESHWQIGANANFGPAEVIFAHSNVRQDSDDKVQTKVGARFAFGGAHTIAVQLESLSPAKDVAGMQNFVGWEGTFGNIKPAVQLGLYAQVDERNAAAEVTSAAQYVAIGANWMMSKTFRLYGGIKNSVFYSEIENTVTGVAGNETTTTDQVVTVGLRKSF